MPRDRSTSRRLLIRRLLSQRTVSSQSQLVDLLAAAGHHVTQTTVSRDLAELGGTKSTGPDGSGRYVIEPERAHPAGRSPLQKVLAEYLEQAAPAGNLVVLKVRPATAGTVAAAIDDAPPDGVLGTLAGDDTVLVVVGDGFEADRVADSIMGILEAQ